VTDSCHNDAFMIQRVIPVEIGRVRAVDAGDPERLEANEASRPVSIDISDEVGGGAKGHPRWTLRLHTPGRALVAQLRNLLCGGWATGPVLS
jgi:hypothetical protein